MQVTGTSEYRTENGWTASAHASGQHPSRGLDVVDVAAADDTAAVLFQRTFAEP